MSPYWIQLLLIVLLPCFHLGLYAEGVERAEQGGRHPHMVAQEQQQADNRHREYQRQRIDYIIKVADLTQEEGAWLEKELIAYDKARMEAWQKRRSIAEALKKANSLSAREYELYLAEWITIDVSLNTAQTSFTMKVREQLPAEKAIKVLVAQHFYNGRLVRQAQK